MRHISHMLDPLNIAKTFNVLLIHEDDAVFTGNVCLHILG